MSYNLDDDEENAPVPVRRSMRGQKPPSLSTGGFKLQAKKHVEEPMPSINTNFSVIQTSWKELDNQITQNIQIIQRQNIALNNHIEKFSIWVRHSYLSVLGKGDKMINQDLKQELERQFRENTDQINSTVKKVRAQIKQVEIQVDQFKEISLPTEE